jgi:hypothetical protein
MSGGLIASSFCSYTLSADEIPSGVKQFYHTNECRDILTTLSVDGGVVHKSTYIVQRVQQACDTQSAKIENSYIQCFFLSLNAPERRSGTFFFDGFSKF